MKDKRRINSLPDSRKPIRSFHCRHTFEVHRTSQKNWHFPKINPTQKAGDVLARGSNTGPLALLPASFLRRNKGVAQSWE